MKPNGRTFIGALDITIPRGLLHGLRSVSSATKLFVEAGADALLLHEGLVDECVPIMMGRAALVLKLTTVPWQADDKTRRVQVSSVRRAASLGASAVAVNCFLGVPHENEMLIQLGRIAEDCEQFGMPLLVMANPRPEAGFDSTQIAYACRVAAEMGADLVKCDYPGSPEDFSEVVSFCPRPIIVEESPLPSTPEGTLDTVEGLLRGGGAGVMFAGRVLDVPNPLQLAKCIRGMLHDSWTSTQAKAFLEAVDP